MSRHPASSPPRWKEQGLGRENSIKTKDDVGRCPGYRPGSSTPHRHPLARALVAQGPHAGFVLCVVLINRAAYA